jgi:choloylglycine hydrolase
MPAGALCKLVNPAQNGPAFEIAQCGTGNTASVEFLKGKMVVHTGDQLAVPTLTNNTYEESLSYAKHIDPQKARSGNTSLDLFTRAAHETEEFEKQTLSERQAVAYAFEVLSDVAQTDAKRFEEAFKAQNTPVKNWTQWSIVYDQKRDKIYFRTLQSPQIKMIDIRAFDYSCGTPVKLLDINAGDEGDVTAKFTNYTRKANRDLIERSFSGTGFLKDVTARARFYMASYPESFKCTSAK